MGPPVPVYQGPGDANRPNAGPASTPSPTSPSPSGPSAPRPAGPTAPAAPGAPGAGPATGGGAPSAPGFGGPATGAPRVVLRQQRGSTSKGRLRIDWRQPVPPVPEGTATYAESALPLAEALQVLWEGDERPLLVLRECSFCQGTDQALLSRTSN